MGDTCGWSQIPTLCCCDLLLTGRHITAEAKEWA